jgi:hypothetical protein
MCCPVEKIDNFFLRSVICIALGIQGADTSAMLAPFMHPKSLVVATDILPILVHVFEDILSTSACQDGRYIAIRSVRIASLVEASIAVIRPAAV